MEIGIDEEILLSCENLLYVNGIRGNVETSLEMFKIEIHVAKNQERIMK